MAAHIMVTNWVVETKVTRAKRLYCLVMDYLWVVSHQLPNPCFLDTRSLKKQMMMVARNCLYLPALSSILELGSRNDDSRISSLPGVHEGGSGLQSCS